VKKFVRELQSLAFLIAGAALFSAVVFLLIRAVNAAPWAWLPILLSPVVAVLALLPLWRRRRARPGAGAALLAEARRPLAERVDALHMKRYPSPDGRFVAVTASNEVRMSHWIDTISVLAVADNRVVLDLPHPWSADDLRWDEENHVHFHARCYPGDAPAVAVDVAPHVETALLRAPNEATKVACREVAAWLDGYYQRHRRSG
jgi:hypothetical protein